MLSGLPDLTLATSKLKEQCMELVACKQYSGGLRSSLVASSLHSEAWHSRLVITVKFGGIKLGGLRSSSVAFKLYSEVWWCHVNLVVAVSDL